VSTRQNKVSDLIRGEVSRLLLRELRDPRIGFVTITAASVSPDLRNAWVYVSVLGGDRERQSTLEALNRASGFIRKEVFRNLRLRFSPTIEFRFDDSLERGARIEETLRSIEAERRDAEPADEEE